MGFLQISFPVVVRVLFFIGLIAVHGAVSSQSNNPASSEELLAAQLMAQKDYQRAAAIYEELFTKNPTPTIYNSYLKCLIELKEFRRAERLVNAQIKDNPGRARFEVDLGYVFDQSGDMRKSRRHFENMVRSVPANPQSVIELANAFLFRDYTDLALQTYERGRQLIGRGYNFNLQIAQIHERKRDYEKMMTEYVELIVLDDTYQEQVQGVLQDAINDDPELTKSEALRKVLLTGTQRNPSVALYSELLLWLSLQQKDFDMALLQARALDRRFRQDGKLVMDVASLAVSNSNYGIARQAYEYVLTLGNLAPYYLEAFVGVLNVKYLLATKGYSIDFSMLREVESEYEKALQDLGITTQTVSLLRNLAHLKAFYLGNTQIAADLLRNVIDRPNFSSRIKGECKVELADILLLQGDLWDAHLLYAQVDKTFRDDPLAHEARFKNARLSFYMGEFKWAKAQLDVLKSATSRLIANDAMALSMLIQDNLDEDGTSVPLQMFARANMHIFMNNIESAYKVLDSLRVHFPGHQITDNVLMTRAMLLVRQGKYQEADKIYSDVTLNYPRGLFAADALFLRARLQETVLNDRAKAMELYQMLIISYSGSLNTMAARNRFRFLRGDSQSSDDFFYHQIWRP